MLSKVTKLFAVLMVAVLLAGAAVPALAQQAGQDQTNQNIIEVLRADGRFNTLVNALQQANLVDTLQGAGPYTIFAPTDQAFAALPQTEFNNVMNDPQQLRDFLMYHVVSDRVLTSDISTMDSLDTAEGEPLAITANGNQVMVGDANIVSGDIMASNGVIHPIDRVLIAPSMQSMFTPQAQAQPGQQPAQQPQAQAQPGQQPQAEAQPGQAQPGQQPGLLPQTGGELASPLPSIAILAGLGLVFLAGGLSLGLRAVKK